MTVTRLVNDTQVRSSTVNAQTTYARTYVSEIRCFLDFRSAVGDDCQNSADLRLPTANHHICLHHTQKVVGTELVSCAEIKRRRVIDLAYTHFDCYRVLDLRTPIPSAVVSLS